MPCFEMMKMGDAKCIRESLPLVYASETDMRYSFVCATSKKTADTVLFTSYPSRGNSDLLRDTKIWEACRAISAAPSFFDALKIGGYREKFSDGGTGANNPVRQLWREAQLSFLGKGQSLPKNLKCIVSIGTGIPSLKPFDDYPWQIFKALKRIATQTEKTAEAFHQEHQGLDERNHFVRFNVFRGLGKIGLEDSPQESAIAAATRRYMESQDVVNKVKCCGKTPVERNR
jgi:predicted acylesterase/phospholipase RssA